MREIPVHELRGGQVLAEDVVCPESAQVLLAAGVRLKRSHSELLERRGVLTVKIEGTGGAALAAETSDGGADEEDATGETGDARDEFADAISKLEHMFEGLDDDPIMRALHAVARGMVESARKGDDGK